MPRREATNKRVAGNQVAASSGYLGGAAAGGQIGLAQPTQWDASDGSAAQVGKDANPLFPLPFHFLRFVVGGAADGQ